MESVIQFLSQAVEFVSVNLMASVGIIATVLEFGLRLVKSEKPLSILYAVKGGIEVAVAIVVKVADLLKAVIAFLDKVLPQRVVQPEQPKQ